MLLSALTLAWLPATAGLAQQDDSAAVATEPAVADTETVPTEPAILATVTDVPEPTLAPTDQPTQEAESTQAPEPTDAPTWVVVTPAPTEPAAIDEASVPTAAPEIVLTYAPASAPVCTPHDGLPETVASGGSLDYDCTFAASVTTSNAIAGHLVLDWIVTAPVTGGWVVQLQPPATDSIPDPAWTAPDANPVRLAVSTRGSFSDEMVGSAVRERVRFRIRLGRPSCAVGLAPVVVGADVAVSLPDASGVRIERAEPDPLAEPFRLAPQLSPIPEPSVTFGGGLDFGSVPVDALGVRQQPAPQTITVTVGGLEAACGAWTLTLKSDSLAATDDAIPSATLSLMTINGNTTGEQGCALADGCAVATIPSGPGAAPTASFALDVALVLPDRVQATTFNTTLTATITEHAP